MVYRLHAEADRTRIELLRILRAVGFAIEHKGPLPEGEREPSEALKLQLERP